MNDRATIAGLAEALTRGPSASDNRDAARPRTLVEPLDDLSDDEVDQFLDTLIGSGRPEPPQHRDSPWQ